MNGPMLANFLSSRLLPKLWIADEPFDQSISDVVCLYVGPCVTSYDFTALYFSQAVSSSKASRLKALFCVTGLDETSLSAAGIVKVGSIHLLYQQIIQATPLMSICFSVAREFESQPTVYGMSTSSEPLRYNISRLSVASVSVSTPTVHGISGKSKPLR